MILLAGQSNMQNLAPFFEDVETVNVAKGGSRIQEWQPGTDHFEHMRPSLSKADALFFWQGESDAIGGKEGAARWDWWFWCFVAAIRCEVAPEALPIFFAEIPTWLQDAPYRDIVLAQQRLPKPEGVHLIPFPETLPMKDHHHVADEGLAVMASLFMEAYRPVALA